MKLKLAPGLFVKILIPNFKKIRENIYSIIFCERYKERQTERQTDRQTDRGLESIFLPKTPKIISSDSARNSRRI